MQKTKIVNPFGDKFQLSWDLWKLYKKEAHKFTYKSPISEQSAINGLVEMSGGVEDKAVAIIKQSLENQWEGFWPIKNFQNGKQPISSNSSRQSLHDALNKRFGNGQ